MKRILFPLLAAAALVLSCKSPTGQAAADVTNVYRSEESPTGYYATFCFPDAGYKEVKIQGEWVFSDLGERICPVEYRPSALL